MQKFLRAFTRSPYRDLYMAIGAAVILIALSFFLGWANNKVVPVHPFPGFHYVKEPHNALSFMANWDGPDYIHIAREGYINNFWINWFPLYPLAIFVTHHIIPSWLDSAFAVAWLSLVGALWFYIKIVRRLFKIEEPFEPLRALIFFVLFPTGVFLVAPFSESLYALFALGAIYFVLKKNWPPTAVLALLCSATHITGIFVVGLVALMAWEEKLGLIRAAAIAAIGSLGLGSYMLFLLIRFHQPFGFVESQQIYHHWTQNTYASLLTTSGFSSAGLVLLTILSAAYWWRRRRKSFSLYLLMFLAIPLVGRQWGGFDRYVLMAFPLEFMLYDVLRRRRELYPYAAAALGIVWTYFLLQYAGGYIGS